jgi:hypothetical protein
MRLGKKLKSGLRTGLKVGAGILGLGAVAVGGYLGSKGSSTPSIPSVAPPFVPTPAVPQVCFASPENNYLKLKKK